MQSTCTCAHAGDDAGGLQDQDDNASPFNSQEAAGDAYERVRSYCLERQVVNYVDVMACFYHLNDQQLQRVFEGLEREGLIEVGCTSTVGGSVTMPVCFVTLSMCLGHTLAATAAAMGIPKSASGPPDYMLMSTSPQHVVHLCCTMMRRLIMLSTALFAAAAAAVQAGPEKDTFIVLHPDNPNPPEPAYAAGPAADGSGKGSAAGSGGGLVPAQDEQQPYPGTESQDPMMQEAGGDSSQVPRGGAVVAKLLQQEQHISQLMTGLSVGDSKAAAVAAGAGAKAGKAGPGSVLARDMRAGGS